MRMQEMSARLPVIGLAPRIIGLVVLTALVSSSVIGLLGASSSRSALQDQILSDAQSQAALTANFMESYVRGATKTLTDLAAHPKVQAAAGGEGLIDIERDVAGFRSAHLNNVAIFDTRGDVRVSTIAVSNIADREWFQAVLKTSQPYVGEPVVGRGSGQPVIPVAAPIRSAAGEVIGVATGSISLQALSDNFAFAGGAAPARTTLVDQREGGIVLASTDPKQIMQPFAAGAQVRELVVRGELATRAGERQDGEQVLQAMTPIAGVPWTVVVEQSADAAFAPIGDLTRSFLLLSLPVILLACLLSGGLALQISRPLRRLRWAIQGLSAGDLSRRLGFTQRDEIGELGRAFDRMADALAARTRDFREAIAGLREEVRRREAAEKALLLAKDELERRVEERTAALGAAVRQNQDAEADLRASEEMALSLTELTPDGIILVDGEGCIVKVNAAAVQMFGWGAAELLALSVEDLLPQTVQERHVRHRSAYQASPYSRAMGLGLYLKARRKDGSEFPVDISLTPLPRREGVVIAAAVRDMTEQKRAEEQLRQAVTDLERSNLELERFAYVSSHDLQEPLRMVSSYTQLLARRYQGRLDEDADVFIGYAVDGARRMQELINDLLAYSRVGARGGEFEPVDAQSALDAALLNLATAVAESDAVITREPLPAVLGDAGHLTQLFQNLIGNAIKFRGEKAPRIHISAQEESLEWVFCVEDNGIGIDPQFAERIFDIFQRLHGRDEYPGTGIGLAICKRIVERHGGRIWVESAPGEGSKFRFVLPQITARAKGSPGAVEERAA